MKNLVISNCLKTFLKENKISEKEESTQFEHFANFCIFSKYAPEAYSDDPFFYDTVHIGSGGDKGVDGILILVNDIEVNDIDQFCDVVNDRPFSAKMVFVQAKTSENFESGDMLKTMIGVKDILSGSKVGANKKLVSKIKLIEKIYSMSANFSENPECYIYFITTGKWVNDVILVKIKKDIEDDIERLNITSKVEFIPIDAAKLQQIYRNATNSIAKEIPLERVVSFPAIQGVKQAFLGLVKINDFINLICDEDGIIQNALFYENVRSFLGENPVNNDIKKTLVSDEHYVHFPILNNGITIVARELNRVGDNFRLSDFQIVNGCQTSNVINDCKNKIRDKDIYCTIKLICTEEPDVIISITKSTNRQTAVTDEAFESLRQFHKELQAYYDAVPENEFRLYYERRSREFDYNKQIKKTKIVSLTNQIKSFLSMFLGEPHSTHRYYGELLKSYRKKMFNDNDKPSIYFASALCLYKVDEILLSSKEFSSLKKYRYHFVMIIGLIIHPNIHTLHTNSHEADKVADKICQSLKDAKRFKKLMVTSCEVLRSALTEMHDSEKNQNTRNKAFTKLVKNKVLTIVNSKGE